MSGRSPATLLFRNRHLLVLSILIALLAGASALNNLPRIEDPRITTRNALILTLLPGASAARVEALVTEKLETRLEEVSEIKNIESTSRAGISVISVELQDDIDASTNEEAFSKVRDKLADAERELPPEAGKPEFDDKRGAVAFTLVAALRWQRATEAPLGLLNRLAEDLADELRNVSGTELVRTYGGADEEISVLVDADELSALGLSVQEASRLIAASDAKGAAGAVRGGRRDVLIEVAGELDSVHRVRAIPLTTGDDGALIRLGDVAGVEKAYRQPADELAFVDGARSVMVAARVLPDVRADRWAEQAREVVARFGETLGGGVDVDLVFDQSGYTSERLSSLAGNLLAGALVVTAVVLVSMGWRAALIVSASLPLSAGIAIFGLTFFGQQIHQMTIFGLIIAIGLLIDNAIVMTDEVRQRLDEGLGRSEAVTAALRHLFVPLLASTLTTILGFMPIFLLPGNIGDFVGPIAISVVLALAASFLLSVTVIATLAAIFLRRDDGARRWWSHGVSSRRLLAAYRALLERVVARPAAAVALALVLPLLGFALAGTLRNQFFPPADRDQFEIELRLPSDASIERTRGVMTRVEEIVRRHDEVRRVSWLAGRHHPTVYYNRIMRENNNSRFAHAIVLATSPAAAKRLIPRLQSDLDARLPEAQVIVNAFAQGPPVESPVGFRIVGPGLEQLRLLGEELRRIMHRVPQITHTRASVSGGEPKLWFEANEAEARAVGLTLDDVASQFRGALEGAVGGTVLEDIEELPVRVRYTDGRRDNVTDVASLNLARGAGGEWVPAAGLGEVAVRPELAGITRRNGERVNIVYGYVTPDALPIEVSTAIRARMEQEGFRLPGGYRLEEAGDSDRQQEAIGQLLTYLPVLLMLMVATVVLCFRSTVLAAVIGAVALLSVGLGMLSLWISGYNLGFNPIIGSAGLIGVAINGTIVVLAAIRANPEAREGGAGAIVAETISSTRHIASTTATTIGGFVPLVLFTGGDFWPPLAIVIAGGVGFSMSLSLIFTPAVYRLIHRRRRAAAPQLAGAPA